MFFSRPLKGTFLDKAKIATESSANEQMGGEGGTGKKWRWRKKRKGGRGGMHRMNRGAEESEHSNTFSKPPPHFWQLCLFAVKSFKRLFKSLDLAKS